MKTTNNHKAYWRQNINLVLSLMSVWFIVSFGCGIIFVDFLNQYNIGGAKLGFWFAQQGAIYVFLILIVIYIVKMQKLDKAYGVDD